MSPTANRTRGADFQDAPNAWNGLQVANSGRATKIGAAVDAGVVPFRSAVAAGIDFLIVHHGMYWDMPRPLTGAAYERRGRRSCGATARSIRATCPSTPIRRSATTRCSPGSSGWLPAAASCPTRAGRSARSRRNRVPAPDLRARLESLYPRVIAHRVRLRGCRGEVAFCSGSGNSAVAALEAAGVDTLVTGELREEHFNRAQEEGLNLYLCGHYATETHGVRALAAESAAKFGLPWEFIATENPL